MSENRKQENRNFCIMINDTSQRSIAMLFKCGGTFDDYFFTNLLRSLFWKNFWTA